MGSYKRDQSGVKSASDASINENNSSINRGDSSKLFVVAQLEEWLFLSGASILTEDGLRRLGVTCVISACPELPFIPVPDSVTICHRVPVLDNSEADIASFFDETSDLIEKVRQDGGRTLVHCVAGISRSATLCLAYLVKHQSLSLAEAWSHVRSRRSCIRPNNGFFNQLIAFEVGIRGRASVKMILCSAARGVIPDLLEPDYRATASYLSRLIGLS